VFQKLIFFLLPLASTGTDPHFMNSSRVTHYEGKTVQWFAQDSRRRSVDIWDFLPPLFLLMLTRLIENDDVIPERARKSPVTEVDGKT
jgi:hypothetical protein